MARKYDFISELYNRTCKTVVANPERWEAFLRSACYNYRLRFDEQLLVHAQRPDATAVLQIDDWNQKFGRWVNRGAHGIAVFEDADRRRQRLVHYFDISDTHPSRFSRRVPIWQMRDEYTAEVIDTLESTFGELNEKETLAAAIESAARNAVEDNIPDYLSDLIYSVKDSFLDGVSEEEITHIFKTAVRNSVAYMMMTRLGIEAGEYFEPDDLRDVVNFTTPATLNALGYATSDIAEMGLAEISRTILALDRQNRIIAEKTKADYNVGKEKTERSPDDERDHLHDAGGLSAPRSDNAGAAGAVDGQVRPDAEKVPEGASQGTLLQPADELRPERASERHGAQSERAGTDADGADGSVGGRDGESESDGYDELGSEDEQYPEPGSGDRDGGGNLRLDYYDRSHEDKSLPFFGGDDTIREILGTTPHLKASKDEIRAFFEATADENARISYIKRIFNNDYTEVILSDGRRVGYKTYQNVLQLWEGSYLSRTAQSFYDWGVIAQHFEAMRLLGELQDTIKPLPSIDGQLSLMTAGAEERKPSAFTFSQEIIDAVLTRGSGISEGKMRIYEQFQKSLSAKENADFLKNEYGWGGAYPVIVGAGIDEQHDGKGIRISKGIGSDKPHIDLKWSQVEKRIAELIKLDRYLNPKEKAQYPEWLQKQEERRAALTEERRNREILSTAPSEKTEPENERYEYHLGSTVYLGANEYEILSFDDERVMLYDTQFPLFNKEMTRAEFDSKVQENPLNDHLKVANKQSEEKAVEFDIGMGYLGNGLTVWNRAVEVNGDYQNIAHISPEGEITFYVQDLPQSVVERIEQAAEREKPKDAALPEFYQAYLKTKADNPSSLLLYQVGDFFEAYADDAEVVGTALDLTQTTRAVDHNTRVPMVGFPQHRLETYLTMLTDRGYDVEVNSLEDGERSTRTVVSTTKEAPVESKPIGRIDYLSTDGKVGESIEYTSPYSFEKDIKEENYYGVPMSIVLYKDKDGNTIPHSFITQLDPPPKGFEIIDSPYLPENALDKAKHLIDDFCCEEYQREDGADYTDLTNVGIAYTTTEDDKHEIQARVNLVDFRIETLADGKVVRSVQYASLEELTEKGLQALSFDDLVYLSEEELAQVEAPLTPVWEHPKKSRVQTFDIHPEIPMADRHTFDLASHEVEEVNKKERFHRNYAAITVLKRCREENRFATPDEQIILSKYVGWGGISEAFDERAGSWQTEFGMLKNILTPEEYASARESTLTAFYTPPTVINAVYKVMKQLGFREGNILEPSCGIGHFIGMLLEEMKESKIYGVELDTVSAGIAQQLYQKSSIAAQGFEETNLLAEQLSEAVSNIHGELTVYEVEDELAEEDNSIPADPTVRNFSYTVLDDKIYFRENSRMAPVEVSATAENRIKGMIRIRDSVRKLIELQTEDYPDSEIKAEQERLNALYDAFSKQYGLINSRANISAFSQDSSFSLLSALEVLGDEGQLERKADIFYKRTIKPHTPVTSVDTSSEALAVSMGEKARVDMDYMCELTGKTEEEIFADLKGVIFLNPMHGYGNSTQAKYLMADEYLSGNVREKLALARKSAELYPEDYTVNVEALERVQPKDLTASEIAVRLGATWLPTEIVEQFMFEFLGTPRYAQWNIKVHFSAYTGEWNIEGKSYDRSNVKAYSTYGTGRINAYKIIEETLNLKDVRIFDYVEDADGKKKAILNKKETAIAQAKQELIKQGFQDWVWSDPERRERLCRLYNDKFNSLRPREYDGSHIVFSGMNPEIELREHQRNAVAHILYGGNTLLAHAVGAGKTFEMVSAAMESKRLGLCSKSLFVVPNHLTEQWASEFLQLYPSANILVATKKDFETKNRKKFCGRIATGDYDAIIIGHSQFEKIPMSIERQRAILEQQLDEVTEGITELKKNRGDNFSVKQLERTKKSVKQKLDKLNDQSKKDDTVTFEELGVDRLFIDESHYYKNLFLFTKMRNVGGIAQTEAMKSSDLFMKCRYLDELTGGRGVVFATGTPISNSMVELYTIQRYLQYNTLVQNNLQHFDAWASTFGETITAVELTPEGTGYRAKTRFARFYNLPELMAMFKEIADIKTADMLDLPVPKAVFHNISVKPSEIQRDMVAGLAERAERVRNGMVDARVDNMLKITNDGRKLALDQRLINPLLPDFEDSKLNACVDAMFETWERGSEKRLTQLFFCDLSTPKNDGSFNVYDDIRQKLIARGVPADEIKFIHEADTEAKKLELFKKVRRGDVRILMGSTQKMGAGTNVQNKLAASSDLDCPWRPSDLEQRLGRSIRQGNENAEVHIYRFVTEETFDAYLYQLVEGKQKFASQIMTSKSPVRSCEDIDETALSYAEIKMLATGNPHIKEKMDLDIQVQKLRLLKSSFLSEKYALEDKIIKFYPQEIARRADVIAGLKSDIERVAEHPKPSDETFVGMTVKGVFYSEKAEAGNAILEACKAMTNPDPIPLGEYRGFPMELYFEAREYKVRLKGELGYPVTLGTDTFGNITRLDNALEGLPKRLEMNEMELDNLKKQFETAKVDVERPFPQEEELKAKTDRLNELNALLNVDKRENEIVGGEPDEGEEPPEKKPRDLER